MNITNNPTHFQLWSNDFKTSFLEELREAERAARYLLSLGIEPHVALLGTNGDYRSIVVSDVPMPPREEDLLDLSHLSDDEYDDVWEDDMAAMQERVIEIPEDWDERRAPYVTDLMMPVMLEISSDYV